MRIRRLGSPCLYCSSTVLHFNYIVHNIKTVSIICASLRIRVMLCNKKGAGFLQAPTSRLNETYFDDGRIGGRRGSFCGKSSSASWENAIPHTTQVFDWDRNLCFFPILSQSQGSLTWSSGSKNQTTAFQTFFRIPMFYLQKKSSTSTTRN